MSNVTPNLTQSIQSLYERFTNLPDLQNGVSEHMQALLNQVQTMLGNQNEFPVDKEDLRKLENILQKDMPGLLDIYEKLPMVYRNEKLLKNHRTHRQNCIANLMLLSDIILDIEDKTISQFDNVMAVQAHALREIYETGNLQTSEVIHNHPVHEMSPNHDEVVQIKKPQVQTQIEVERETEDEAETPEIVPIQDMDLSPFFSEVDNEDNFAEPLDEETQALLKNLEPPTQESQRTKELREKSNHVDTHLFGLGNDDLLDNLLFTDDKKLPLIKKGTALVDNFNWIAYRNNHPELNLQTMEQTFIKPATKNTDTVSATDTYINKNVNRYQKRKADKALQEEIINEKNSGVMTRFLASMNSFYRKITLQKSSTQEMEKFLRMIKSDTFSPEFPFSYHDKVKKCQEMLPRALKDKGVLAPEVIEHCVMYIADSGAKVQLLRDENIMTLANKNHSKIFFDTLTRYDNLDQWWRAKDLEEDESYKYLLDVIKTGDDNKIMFAVYNTLRFNPAFLSEANEVGKKNLAYLNQYEYAAECLFTYYEDEEDKIINSVPRHAHMKARQDAIDEEKKLLEEKIYRKLCDMEYDREQEELENQQDLAEEIREMEAEKIRQKKEDQEYGLLTLDDYENYERIEHNKKVHQWLYPDVDENLFINEKGMYFENLDEAISSLKYDLEKSQSKSEKYKYPGKFIAAVAKAQAHNQLYQNQKNSNSEGENQQALEDAKAYIHQEAKKAKARFKL